MMLSNRRPYLDVLRILACFLVIFNHLSGYIAYQQSTNAIQAFYYMGYTMFTRINVPIFFMISGSLLLSKDIKYKDLFFNRIIRIIGALFSASFVLYLFSIIKDLSSFSLVVFLEKLLAGKHSGTYWYLYAYLGFLVTTPFLHRIAKQFSHADFNLLFSFHFIFATFIPLLNYVLSSMGIPTIRVSNDFNLPLMTLKAFFYPLIGYYIDHVFDISKLNKRNIWILPAIILIGSTISSCFTYHQGISSGYTQDFVQTFDYTTAISVFLLVKYLFVNVRIIRNCTTVHLIASSLASLTFGIYLIDPALKYIIKYFNAVVTTQNPISYSIIRCLFSMAVGGSITFVFKKIPLINKLL